MASTMASRFVETPALSPPLSHQWERGDNTDGFRRCWLPQPRNSRIASSIAVPSSALRAPFQPTAASGRSALSLNGISSVSDRQPKVWPMYFDASLSASALYLLAA